MWSVHRNAGELGLQLGADVPIFVHGKTAFAEGVGEQIHPVSLEESWYLVVFPGVQHQYSRGVFAPPIYRAIRPRLTWQHYTFDGTQNDCQKIVCKSQPEVAKLLQWLLHYAPSRMTGTGACVFATFSDPDQAKAVQQALA